MDFSPPPRRRPDATILPMINVVFLLLIFFLISARLVPPEPFAVTPPEGRAAQEVAGEAEGDFTLHLSATGEAGYRADRGDAALAALTAAREDHCRQVDCTARPPRLLLRGDASLPASRLAALLPRLSGLGFAEVALVLRPGAAE